MTNETWRDRIKENECDGTYFEHSAMGKHYIVTENFIQSEIDKALEEQKREIIKLAENAQVWQYKDNVFSDPDPELIRKQEFIDKINNLK